MLKNLENLNKNPNFIKLISKQCRDILEFLSGQDIEFSIVVNVDFIRFDPPLPDELRLADNPYVLFTLGGYTLSSLEFGEDDLCFHAGFGPDDFASYVSVDLGAIVQIQVEDNVIFINTTLYQGKNDENPTQNSKKLFLKNNQGLFKK